MVNITLTAIIVVAIMLVALAPFVWRRQKTEEPEAITGEQKKAFFAQWIIGIVLALVAAVFMFDGDVLGENTTAISTVLGIIGICLIATSNISLLSLKRK